MRMPCESCRYSLCPCTLWEKPAIVNRLLMMAVFNGPRTGQWFETLFGGAAHRTVPIFGCLIEGRAFGYFTFAIASVGIVNAAAIHRLALIHVSRFGHGRTPYTSNRLQKTPWRLMKKNNHPVNRVNAHATWSGWVIRPSVLEALQLEPCPMANFFQYRVNFTRPFRVHFKEN
jgi:hypothetical protein